MVKSSFEDTKGEEPFVPVKLCLPTDPLAPSNVISPLGYSSVAYFQNAITPPLAAHLMSFVDSRDAEWVELRGRRLRQLGGQPQSGGFLPIPLPPLLASLGTALVDSGLFPPTHPPNHILINDYALGEGITAHTDGPRYYPTVATLSLLDSAVMSFTVLHGAAKEGEKGGQVLGDVVLEENSLVVTWGDCYSRYAHSISEKVDTVLGEVWNRTAINITKGEVHSREGRRVSITIRHAYEKG